ncbi:MAG: hypothetical protein SCK28_06450 [Bacillota bacterium]|nr:hypothetical protein [Bacillota bacterium]
MKVIATEKYNERHKRYHSLEKEKIAVVNRISQLRFVTFVIGTAAVVYLQLTDLFLLSFGVALGFIILFIILVFKHQKAIDEKSFYRAMVQINENALMRIKGEWKNFSDAGEDFKDESHSYANDLDIFGKGSLFQWINTTTTYLGRETLRKVLREPCESIEEIEKRQEAIEELAGKLNWRQEFMAEGLIAEDSLHDPRPLYRWASERHIFFANSIVIACIRILPIITAMLILSSFLFGLIPNYIPIIAIGLQFMLLIPGGKKRNAQFAIAEKYKNNLKAYSGMIKLLEKEEFKAVTLTKLQKKLHNKQDVNASAQLTNLDKVIDAISYRYNQLFIVINILLLWDYQCQIALERWKKESGNSLEKWIEVIAEFEALASLANIRYDNPDWTMPNVVEESMVLRGAAMGHPLLVRDRISNDLQLEPPTNVLLITGSNMSGKSTFLRTAGINLVLAYIGAPVCATRFTCSLLNIYTCMRISDSLDKSISSFYAELLRIKMIVAAVEEGKKVFFLLDEIFKGTNSVDRHIGAKELINKLSRDGAMGLVSTHDLELGDLEKDNKRIKNYHFKEYYQNDQLLFDYKLQPGLSTTRNAIYLMKIAGIVARNKN